MGDREFEAILEGSLVREKDGNRREATSLFLSEAACSDVQGIFIYSYNVPCKKEALGRSRQKLLGR